MISALDAPLVQNTPSRRDQLKQVAEDLEAAFLSEMLKSAGLGKPSEAFGGGIGEEQFGSFMRQEQARQMVEAGGIGLAEHLFKALSVREARNDPN